MCICYKHLNFLQKFLQQIGSRLIQRLLSFVLIKKSQKVSNNVEGIFKLKPRGNFFAELTLEKCFQSFFFFLSTIYFCIGLHPQISIDIPSQTSRVKSYNSFAEQHLNPVSSSNDDIHCTSTNSIK
jgi:hypothetical protein